MRNVSDSAVRFGGRKSALFLMLAIAAAIFLPGISQPQALLAQDEGAPAADAAADAGAAATAGGTAATPAPAQSRSFLSYIARALGWFWGPAFLLVSFILVALIMMNMLQVRRDVLLPTQFVEEFEQKLNAKDFQAAYEFARGDDSFVARVLSAGMGRLSRGYSEAVEGSRRLAKTKTCSWNIV